MIKRFFSLPFIMQAILVGVVSGIATLVTFSGGMSLTNYLGIIGIRFNGDSFFPVISSITGVAFGVITAPFFIHYSNLKNKSEKILSFIYLSIAGGISFWAGVTGTIFLIPKSSPGSFMPVLPSLETFALNSALGGILGAVILLLSFRLIFNIKLSVKGIVWIIIAGGGIPVIVSGAPIISVISIIPAFALLFIVWQTSMVILLGFEIRKQSLE